MAVVEPPVRAILSWRLPVFAIYVILLVVTTCFHESWFDEAQAWLMARDLTPKQLWFHQLRYEGTPGLWHTLLLIPAKLGFPYGSIHVVSCIAACAATAAVLWLAPFSPVVTATLPFTYFLIYQYAVIARSYTLLPLLFVLTAVALPQARRRTYVFVLILILMASTSMHGVLAAIGIGIAYMIEFLVGRKRRTQEEHRRHAISCAVFAMWLIVLAAQVWPPSDLSFLRNAHRPTLGKATVIAATDQIEDALTSRVGSGARGWVLRVVDLAPAALVLALSAHWFHKQGTLWYFVLPMSAVLMLSSFVYYNHWHSGVIFLIWLFAMWITATRSQQTPPAYVWLVWLTVLLPQVYWSARSIAYDVSAPYSGSKTVAEYLKSQGLQDSSIYGSGYEAISIQPYFTKNIFANYHDGQKPAFWLWNTSNRFPQLMSSIPPERPDVLVVALRSDEEKTAAEQLIRRLPDAGYVLAGRFDGQLFWKSSVLETESFLVARRVARRKER